VASLSMKATNAAIRVFSVRLESGEDSQSIVNARV
jgi:hypothetical protein